MGQKHEKFREFRTHFPRATSAKNPRNVYARMPQAMAQFVLKIELLSHIMVTTLILGMAPAYGLRPRLWLLVSVAMFLIRGSFLHGRQRMFFSLRLSLLNQFNAVQLK